MDGLAKGEPMQLRDQAVVDFLCGESSVRDGRLVGLSLSPGENEWEVVLHLLFDVPNGTHGENYELVLWGNLAFDYGFSSESTLRQIAFVKCLWTNDGFFYLSLDPWNENEPFISDQDNDCFRSRSVTLTVARSGI